MMHFTFKGLLNIRKGTIVLLLSLIAQQLTSQCLPNSITTADGETEIFACSGDGKPDNYSFIKSDTSNNKYAFVLADGGDNILKVQTSPQFDFDGPQPALLRVWGVSYSDTIAFTIGQDVSTIRAVQGCVRLSENVIRVIRDFPTGENAFFANGSRDTFYCYNNSTLDTVMMQAPKNVTGRHIFLITLFDGKLIDFFSGNIYVIDQLPKDSYFIYDVAFSGTFTINKNDNIFSKNISNGCFSIGQRPSRIDIDTIKAALMIPLTTKRLFCVMDARQDTFSVAFNNDIAIASALILLDNQNICRQISLNKSILLNNNVPGNYLLYGANYSGRLLLHVGDTINMSGATELSTDCFEWSLNNFAIKLDIPKAGKIISASGDTVLYACPGDRLPDRFTFSALGQSALSNYVIIVVDSANKVIATTNLDGFVDFEGLGTGKCKAYGVSYTGDLLAVVGSPFTGNISNECFAITPNYINIFKEITKGGTINLKGGATSIYVCNENDSIRMIEFERKNASNSLYQYVLTSESGVVINFVKNDSLSFYKLPLSAMRIYGVAYSGKITIGIQSNIFVSSFSDGCYSISENFIQVLKLSPNGGGIRLPDGSFKELFCPSDPAKKTLTLRNVDVTTNPYSFVLTDSSRTILDIFQNFVYSFDSLPTGQYFVYGVSYIGNITITKGSKLDLGKFSSDCFNYSPYIIEIIIGEINGGILTSSEGSANVFTCPSNLDPDPIQMIPLGARSLGYRYVITNDQNIIIGFSLIDVIDFGNNPINSTCRVYGVAYKGEFTGVLGRNVLETSFSQGCYSLSKNFVRVRKTVPPPHRLLYSVKDSVITLCVGDSQADTIKLSTSDSIGFKTVYIGVEDGKISRIYSKNLIEFEKDTPGITKIYSLIFTGQLLASPGLALVNGLALSDDCFSLSSNFLVVDKVNKGPFCVITSNKDETWLRQLKVYPNPVNGAQSLLIEFENLYSESIKAEISIYNMNGVMIKKIPVSLKTYNQIRIQTDDIPSGIYTLNINTQRNSAVRKIVILR